MTDIVKDFTYNLPDEPGVATRDNNEVANARYTGPRYIYVFLNEDNTLNTREVITDDSGEDFVPMPGLTKVKIDAEQDPLVASLVLPAHFTLVDEQTEVEQTLSNGEIYAYDWPIDLATFDYPSINYTDGTWNIEFDVWESDWDGLKNLRNSLLAGCDGRVASDVPEELRTAWINYRQKLRDLPTDWDGIPSWKVTVPTDPDGN